MSHHSVSNRPIDRFFYHLDRITAPINDPLNRLATNAGPYIRFISEDIGDVISGRGTPRAYLVTGLVAVAAVTAVVALVTLAQFIIGSILTGFGKGVAFVAGAKSVEGQVKAQLIGQAILAGLIIGAIRSISSS